MKNHEKCEITVISDILIVNAEHVGIMTVRTHETVFILLQVLS
jgi:hypothetical protein